MRNRLHPRTSEQHSVFEVHELESPKKWNFKTHIGTGGFAKVYRESITPPVFGKHVCAVKRIPREDVRFPYARKLYEREIKIFSKLKQVSSSLSLLASTVCMVALGHRRRPLCIRYSLTLSLIPRSLLANLSRVCFQNDLFVQFLDSHEDAQYICIVMEYMEWGDLVPYIRDRWNESDTAIVTHQLLCGLQYLHQNGITHRDLKPAVSIIPFKASLAFQRYSQC